MCDCEYQRPKCGEKVRGKPRRQSGNREKTGDELDVLKRDETEREGKINPGADNIYIPHNEGG